MGAIDIVLLLATTYCVYTDIRYEKIRNHITFPLMITGIAYNSFVYGWSGSLFALKGMALGILLAVIAIVGGLGMGDVKLFMGIGAVKGMVFSLDVIIFSLFLSILAALILKPRSFIKALRNVFYMSKNLILFRCIPKITIQGSALKLTYAVYIFIGLIVTYIIGGD
ncbi:MAG: A24 family peptidase, partial [Candidatus Methanomethylophilus sp.]|nr:A24 family peptidase [Methanomethylophilus sp.]